MKKPLIQNQPPSALDQKPFFWSLDLQPFKFREKRSLNISGTTSKARFIYIFAASNQVRESLAKEGKSSNLVYTNMNPDSWSRF